MNNDEFQKLMLEMMKDLKSDIKDFKIETRENFTKSERNLNDFKTETRGNFSKSQTELERINHRLDRIEDNQYSEKKRIDKVYEAREKVKITFGWQWGMVSFFIAIGASAITKILLT